MKRVLIGLMGAVALGVFAAPASAQDAKIERGIKVYAEQKCMMCHSIAGKGNAKGSLDGVGTKLTAEEIRLWMVDPAAATTKHKAERKPAMPAKYTTLPKEDMDALIAYMVSLKKK
jgi:mono/diheme cytochrome c family protein